MEIVERRAKKELIYPFLSLIKLTYFVYLMRLYMMMSVSAPNDLVHYPRQVELRKLYGYITQE